MEQFLKTFLFSCAVKIAHYSTALYFYFNDITYSAQNENSNAHPH